MWKSPLIIGFVGICGSELRFCVSLAKVLDTNLGLFLFSLGAEQAAALAM